MSYWEFTELARKNPSHTKTFLNSFNQRGFSAAQVLAREVIQNTTDAGRKVPGKTHIEFQSLTFQGSNKEKLLQLLKMKEALEPRVPCMGERKEDRGVTKAISNFLDSDEINALVIRDFKTCGLGGKLFRYENSDHFYKLVCATHLDNKSDNEVMGGSFGLGKTVYAKSSDIYSVIYHSTFKQTKDTDGDRRRLMMAGVYPMHKFEGKSYQGFGYFGEASTQESGELEAIPFSNERAEDIWSEIASLSSEQPDLKRAESDYGTDILILGCNLNLHEIQTATEDFWFPSLLNDDLSVQFFHSDGRVTQPNPEGRDNLDQFIRLWRKTLDRLEVKSEKESSVDRFQKISGNNVGWISFERAEEDEAASEKTNTVALMRSGTNLILSYMKYGSERYEHAVGFFIADEDVSGYLQASEDEAHSEWSFQSDRLKRSHGEEGRYIVKSVTKRIGDRFARFQKSLQPELVKTAGKGGLLSRLLTQVLTGEAKANAVVDSGEDAPFSRSFKLISRTAERSQWGLKITENDLSPESPIDLKIKFGVHVAGEKMIAVKKKEFLIKDRSGNQFDTNNLIFEFSRNTPIDLIIEFDSPGNFNYKLGAAITVKHPQLGSDIGGVING